MKNIFIGLIVLMAVIVCPHLQAQQPAQSDFMKKALIVVNGEIVPLSRLDSIPPSNIASVEVMKEDAAIAQYGEKGKSGVVIITLHNAQAEPALQRREIAGAIMENVAVSWDSSGVNRTMGLKVIYRDSTDIDARHRPGRRVLFYGEGQQPLILLNGKEISYAQMQELDPATFSRVEVLNGDDARAAYGEKGNYGVVRITLKNLTNELFIQEGRNTDLKDSVFIDASHRPLERQAHSKEYEKALILLDGKEISHEKMQQLDPATFSSVDVLKGDAALKAYGEKGKFGVIRITSKN